MALDAGTVRITVSYGKDLRDTDWFKKGDPYALLACGNHSFRTRTAHRAGSSPVWNEVFSFPVINENVIQMTIKDEDMIGRDDLIGCCTISLARAREQGSDMQQAPVLCPSKKNKQRGFVQVSLVFERNSDLRPRPQPQAQAQPWPQPHPQPQQQQPQQAAPYSQPGGHGYGYPPLQAPYYAGPPPTYSQPQPQPAAPAYAYAAYGGQQPPPAYPYPYAQPPNPPPYQPGAPYQPPYQAGGAPPAPVGPPSWLSPPPAGGAGGPPPPAAGGYYGQAPYHAPSGRA